MALCVILGQPNPGPLSFSYFSAWFGIFLATSASSFIFLPMRCEILSPARHKHPVTSQSSACWPFLCHLEQLCNYLALPWRDAFSSLLCFYYPSLAFYFCCFVFYCFPRGEDLCLNSGLVPKCLKCVCCTDKFAVLTSFCLSVNSMQYIVKLSFSF